MKTTAIDIATHAVRDDVEAEQGYNHEVDVEEYQQYLAIQEASMGDYQSDAETLVVESKEERGPGRIELPPGKGPYVESFYYSDGEGVVGTSDASRQRGQKLLNTIQGTLAAIYAGHDNAKCCEPRYNSALDALYELSQIIDAKGAK